MTGAQKTQSRPCRHSLSGDRLTDDTRAADGAGAEVAESYDSDGETLRVCSGSAAVRAGDDDGRRSGRLVHSGGSGSTCPPTVGTGARCARRPCMRGTSQRR
jgi:hypothetical protein